MFEMPTIKGWEIGPDITKGHIIATYRGPRGFETIVWRRDSPEVPVDEVQSDNWEDALIAHARVWHWCTRMEKAGRLWAYREAPRTPKKDLK